MVFETSYGDSRQLVSWVLGLGSRARILEPPELVDEAERARCALVVERHSEPTRARAGRPKRRDRAHEPTTTAGASATIRPERFARLVTLAGILIDAARARRQARRWPQLARRLQITETELRQDIDVLNVVNFGGGSYVLYAEVQGDTIEVDPEPYGDNFASPRACCRSRPRRWWRRST